MLTGLIVSLLAQGMTAFDAAHLGAHLHGVAGDLAAERFGERFVTSVEVVQCLADAWLAGGFGSKKGAILSCRKGQDSP